MTLIASFRQNGIPVLVGDLLISGFDYDVPRKKIVRINDQFVVGWAGSLWDAHKIMIPDIRTRFASNSPTRGELDEYFAAIDVSQFYGELVLVGWGVDAEGVYPYRWKGGKNVNGQFRCDISENYIEGTGSKFFEEELEHIPLKSHGQIQEPDDLEKATSSVLVVMTRLTNGEYLSVDKSWREQFGFGWETLIYNGRSFEYLSDILYLTIDFEIDQLHKIRGYRVLPDLRRYTSFGDWSVLDIRSEGSDLHRHLIGEPDDDKEAVERKQAGLIAIYGSIAYRLPKIKKICVTYRFIKGGHIYGAGVLVFGNDSIYLRFTEVGISLGIVSLRGQFLRDMERRIGASRITSFSGS